jgi:hypothetical protein
MPINVKTEFPMASAEMLNITLPDGAVRQVAAGTTPLDIAEAISKGLAKKCVAAHVNGKEWDLTRPFEGDASLALITRDTPEGLDVLRHDCAHVLAQAVQELFSRHAGDDRAEHRGWLLLRLRARGKILDGRLRQD